LGLARDLRADRWHQTPPEEVIDEVDSSGIQCQIWERAKIRTRKTHSLAGGGGHNVGYVALPWDMICTAAAEHMASTGSLMFFLTRLRVACFNSTQSYMPAKICPNFPMIQAQSPFTADS
jgi:hypothetical protein